MAFVDTSAFAVSKRRVKRVTTVTELCSEHVHFVPDGYWNKFCYIDCYDSFVFITVQSQISLNYLKLQVISRKLSLGCVSVFFLANN